MPHRSIATKRTITVECTSCGNDITVGANTRRPKRCIECGMAAAATAAREMHEKSGTTYERWQAAMVRCFANGP